LNAGQKMIYWIVVLGGGAVAASGCPHEGGNRRGALCLGYALREPSKDEARVSA
jgi:hypothetical protein